MIFVLYIAVIIAVIVAIKLIFSGITKNITEDYHFLQSQRENTDTVQSLNNKAITAMGGNSFIDSMVSASLINQDPDAHSKNN